MYNKIAALVSPANSPNQTPKLPKASAFPKKKANWKNQSANTI